MLLPLKIEFFFFFCNSLSYPFMKEKILEIDPIFVDSALFHFKKYKIFFESLYF